jgi:hypothetical protein
MLRQGQSEWKAELRIRRFGYLVGVVDSTGDEFHAGFGDVATLRSDGPFVDRVTR